MHCNRWNGDAQRAGCWCRCWSTAKCHCVRDGKCGADARRAVCARRMQFQKRLCFPQRVQPVTATACLGRVMQCPTGSRKPPGATPPGERGKAAANAGKRGGNAERGKPPRKRGGCGYSLSGICTTRRPNRCACCIQLAVPRPPGNANRIASGSASIAALHISAFRRGPAALPYLCHSAAKTLHFVPVFQHHSRTM